MSFAKWAASWTPFSLLWVFCLINFWNFVDRGIVPGAFNSIGAFISETTHSSQTDTLIGVVQSAFIVGYAGACLGFGNLVHRVPPFKLMTVGMAVWVVACVLSGLSPNFYVFVVARVISGVGEASFQIVVPPYIDSHAPTSKRGLWLSIFYLAIPVGSAGAVSLRAHFVLLSSHSSTVSPYDSWLCLWRGNWSIHFVASGVHSRSYSSHDCTAFGVVHSV